MRAEEKLQETLREILQLRDYKQMYLKIEERMQDTHRENNQLKRRLQQE
jgi:hypothetical protein